MSRSTDGLALFIIICDYYMTTEAKLVILNWVSMAKYIHTNYRLLNAFGNFLYMRLYTTPNE